jgi:hypothetical protein
MKNTTRQIWLEAFRTMVEEPAILMPFVIVAFLEGLCLIIVSFFPSPPLSLVFAPIIRKFFGEAYLHYPNNLVLLSTLFYYIDTLTYAFVAIALSAISVNIFKNIKMRIPYTITALIRNTLKKYVSFLLFGLLMVFLLIFLKRVDTFLYNKIMRFAAEFAPNAARRFYPVGLMLLLYVSNIVIMVFFVCTIPLMVLQKKRLFKALLRSVYLGLRHFFQIFALLFVPFLVYFPLILLKNWTEVLMAKTFPEITLVIMGAGILVTIFIDCFMLMTACQFIIVKEKQAIVK